jgi:hypothetical protein
MHTDKINLDKTDNLAIGSQFVATRNDELEHSVIYYTRSAPPDSDQTPQTVESVERPTGEK